MKTKNKIDKYLKGLSPKDILDIGCGPEPLSERFLKINAKITAIDKEDRIKSISKEINFIHKDIRDFEIKGNYDLILPSLVLHYLSEKDALSLIKKIKKHTTKGGYNFILTMSNNEDNKREGKFYPKIEELKELYSDWEIVNSEEFKTETEEHDGMPLHFHRLIILLAKNKKGAY